MSKYNELVAKLREVFQINRPELDFGIYRILNARSTEINEYLDKRLKEKVRAALDSGSAAGRQQIEHELKEAEKQAAALAVPPEHSPKVRELRERLTTLSTGSHEHENAVFSHLLTFFSRYYDNGDFISQRRYKGDTYAIPYAGEEVMLHWANKDQYYTKSGENFSNYSFKLDDGRTVHFRLVAADTAKDNRKDNDKERRFALIERMVVTRQDDEGDDYEEELLPVEASDQELVLRFAYQPMPKGTKQDALTSAAIGRILADAAVQADWAALATRMPTENNPQRTLLEKHLTTYTTRNTADYFIHKDLGGFLRRELDFYIKSEVMNLDDVQHAEQFAHIEKSLRMIQCLRAIALDLIDFLAQLENFQKKLWLKKKFVVSADYCITLDRVPEELYPEIAANERQWAQWHALGLRDSAVLGTAAELKKQPAFMVDTSSFAPGFKHRLLNSISNIDKSLNGLLIHSDNFQGLQLISNRYNSDVDCLHIDPPYNTETSGFLYKNTYEHSSWLTLMSQTNNAAMKIISEQGALQCHIDENEYENLFISLKDTSLKTCGTIIWDKKNPMLGRKGVATQHEYILWWAKNAQPIYLKSENISYILNQASKFISDYGGVNEISRRKFSQWIGAQENLTGGERAYKLIEDDGRVYRGVAMGAPELRDDPKYHIQLIHPITKKPCPVPPNGWSRSPETLQELINKNQILWGADDKSQPQKKVFLSNDSKRQLSSVIQDANSGKKFIDALGLAFPYCHPLSLYIQILGAIDTKNRAALFCDYFAGSGTTAHALISLNRSDNSNRRYILIDQGNHFVSVLKPRVEKVVYSSDWKNGKPTAPETGISHCFKVLKLESYEDTLNNLALRRDPKQAELLAAMTPEAREDYLLHYLLDVESRGSLLSVEDFRKPFDYTLKIAVDSAGACEPRKIDLVETFNYLIGLTVQHIDMQLDRGFVSVTGVLPSGETALILWRDCDKLQYTELAEVCDKLAINPNDSEFDVVYLNGDHNIPAVSTANAEDGGATRVLKLRQIEPEFLTRMFDVEDV